MRKITYFVSLAIILMNGTAFAEHWEKIVAKEIEGYRYNLSGDWKMESFKPEFEITYHRSGDEIHRVGVYNIKTKEIKPDNTVYKIQRQLSSDVSKTKSLQSFSGLSNIRAIGQSDPDSVEILTISKDDIINVRSTGYYIAITRLKRIK